MRWCYCAVGKMQKFRREYVTVYSVASQKYAGKIKEMHIDYKNDGCTVIKRKRKKNLKLYAKHILYDKNII